MSRTKSQASVPGSFRLSEKTETDPSHFTQRFSAGVRSDSMDDRTTRRRLGDQAEELVARWLGALGLTVLERNVRLGYLEIDIVARDGSVLALIEVRRRGRTSRTTGFSSISPEKRKRLRFAGERLWNRRYRYDTSFERVRFDVASVSFDGARPVIEYVKAAF